MPKSLLRCAGRWIPIEKSEAKRLGLTVAPFAPTHEASEFGLIPDTSVWLESQCPPYWRVALRLASQGGAPVVAEVRVFPDEEGRPKKEPHASAPGEWSGTYGARRARIPPGGITARLLHSIRLCIFRRDLQTITTRRSAMQWNELHDDKADPEFGRVEPKHGMVDVADILRQLARADPRFPLDGGPVRPIRRRRSGRSDRELLRVARIYERVSLSGRPVTAAVAKGLKLTPSKARDAISRARYLGFLPPTKQGRGGGLLTERARKLLNVKKHKGGTRT